MARVKRNRASVFLDMTAMCDMAFLLLTFFILTTKMKAPEPYSIDIPTSISDIKLDSNKRYVIITASKEGKVFLGVNNKDFKKEIITTMNSSYDLKLSDKQIKQFLDMESFGVPLGELNNFLTKLRNNRNLYATQPGIPVDTTKEGDNELLKWLTTIIYEVDNKAELAIRGDRDTPYKIYRQIVNTIQHDELNINKFSLITVMLSEREE